MPQSSVKQCMHADPPRIAPHANLREAAERMCAHDVTFLVVMAADHDPVGLFTDRDLTAALASRRDPETTPVREVIAPATTYCRESDDLEDAAWLMERHQARRLIVLDGERRLAGVISVDDIARGVTTRLAGDVLRHTQRPAS